MDSQSSSVTSTKCSLRQNPRAVGSLCSARRRKTPRAARYVASASGFNPVSSCTWRLFMPCLQECRLDLLFWEFARALARIDLERSLEASPPTVPTWQKQGSDQSTLGAP